MPRVADRAGSDCAVSIRLAYTVALFTSAGHRRPTFQLYKRVRWAPGSSRLVCFREVDLLGSQPLLAVYGRPRRRGMPAAQELLINVLVATTAVASRQFGRNYESVMVFLLLPSSWLVAVQAIYTVSRVH